MTNPVNEPGNALSSGAKEDHSGSEGEMGEGEGGLAIFLRTVAWVNFRSIRHGSQRFISVLGGNSGRSYRVWRWGTFPGTTCLSGSNKARSKEPPGVTLHAAIKEGLGTGSRATTTVPVSVELISKLPPSCRSRSRIPLIPTPAVPSEFMTCLFSGGMPLPLSSTSRLIWLPEQVTRILATGLCEWR